MNNRRGYVVAGALLVILGGLFLLRNLGVLEFGIFNIGFMIAKFWPTLFLVIPGLLFHSVFFSGKSRDAGLLVPGGILLVLGITFQINMLFGMWHIMWPFYIMSVAVGLFELYVFGNREKGLLIPVGILAGFSLFFFAGFSLRQLLSINVGQYVFPAVLILIGAAILLKGRRPRP